MRVVRQEYTRINCPDCTLKGSVSKLKRVVEEWNPFQDSGNNFYEIHVLLCNCGYASITKNQLEPFKKVPYRLNSQLCSTHD